MTFDQALKGVLNHEHWKREAWRANKKIFLQDEEIKDGVIILSHLKLQLDDGRQTPWLPTRCDILGTDWVQS